MVRVLLVVCCIFLSSCTKVVYVDSVMPIIEMPERPAKGRVITKNDLETRPAWSFGEANKDLLAVRKYALQLEASVKAYNERAKRLNEENRKKLLIKE